VQIHPTRATFHVALAGSSLIAMGIVSRLAAPVAFGGAMILAIALGRALALATVTRLRASGFEMVWASAGRLSRVERGSTLVLTGELRNRSPDDARGVRLRPLASSMLSATIEPSILDLPRGSKASFNVHLRADRVGRWGLHGVSLEVRGTPLGGEGLFEVPLMFANPQGIEVVPKALGAALRGSRGGRSRIATSAQRSAPVRGDGDSFKELREHMPGDPFKRIAWRATARRGQLLVREMERDERDVVWILLDASVELWAGEPGSAPLDFAVDEVARVATRHLARGDLVGLAVFASRIHTWLEPAGGRAHAAHLTEALMRSSNALDADRSDLDESDIAIRVLEHMRPLDPRIVSLAASSDLDALTVRATALGARAPFSVPLPVAPTPREQKLRHYLSAFGVEAPPRVSGEEAKSSAELARLVAKLAREKSKRPSLTYIFARFDPDNKPLLHSIRALRKQKIELVWSLPAYEPSLSAVPEKDPRSIASIVHHALKLQVTAKQSRAVRAMRAIGIRPAKTRSDAPLPTVPRNQPSNVPEPPKEPMP
jgi:uncharacterized protein (DUF58 family)